MSDKRLIYLVAGGTGGHINGALALSELLGDYNVQFLSSDRSIDKKILKEHQAWFFFARALKGKGVFATLKNIFLNGLVFIQVFVKTIFNRPDFSIGLGGFICGPALLACHLLRVPVYLVEQNSVMGMANRLLVPISENVFTHFDNTKGYPEEYKEKAIKTGNPIRGNIQYVFKEKSETLNVLVFGGSLGAHEINEYVEELVSKNFSYSIHIKHQVGLGREIKVMPAHNVKYEQLNYIDEMNEAYAWSDVIISRGGASTISELKIVKRPVMIAPYPHADEHQKYNALNMKEEVGFRVGLVDKLETFEDRCLKIKSFLDETYSLEFKDYSGVILVDPRVKILSTIGISL